LYLLQQGDAEKKLDETRRKLGLDARAQNWENFIVISKDLASIFMIA